MASLKQMNREQLNEEAKRLGIENPEQFETNANIIEAIEGTDGFKAEQEAAAKAKAEEQARKDAEQSAPKPAEPAKGGRYIVNGKRVDANGKPVKG